MTVKSRLLRGALIISLLLTGLGLFFLIYSNEPDRTDFSFGYKWGDGTPWDFMGLMNLLLVVGPILLILQSFLIYAAIKEDR